MSLKTDSERDSLIASEFNQKLLKEAEATVDQVPAIVYATRTADELQFELNVHQIELEMQNETLRQLQIKLEESLARYVDLYEFAPVGYLVINSEAMIAEANLKASTMLGVARSKLIHRRFAQFIADQDKDRWHLMFVSLKNAEIGREQNFDILLERHDRSSIHANVSCQRMDNRSESHMLRVVLTDITARKHTEHALHEQESSYRNLINSIDEGFCVIEVIFDACEKPIDYLFLEINQSFEKQSGLLRATGKRMSEFSRNHETYWYEIYGKVALTGEPIRFENVVNGLNSRWFDVYACRLGGPESRKVSVLFQDITERKHTDAALIEAKLASDLASNAKTEFLSRMSHELRTPLNTILGFAQLLETGTPPPTDTQNVKLNHIIKAGWYLLEMINEILDLSAIESGKLSLLREAVSLTEVMSECQSMLEPQTHKLDIHINFLPFDNTWFVYADRIRLKQVLLNLLSNSIDYNREHGTVEVKCTCIHERLRISIEDSGLGMPEEQLLHLFQPYSQLRQESSMQQGMGIGLVMAKHLVELMNGTIGAESTVGAGSEFWIELDRYIVLNLADGN